MKKVARDPPLCFRALQMLPENVTKKIGFRAFSYVGVAFRFITREDVVFGLLGSDSPQAPQN